MLRASLKESYETKLREKDQDLTVLRREMLEAVTKFSSDKQDWELELAKREYEWTEEKVKQV